MADVTEPFLGEIRLFPIDFVPRGWSSCEGQTISIQQNPALYSLLGTVYGGNGQTTFALPDLRGRVPIHPSNFTSLPLGTKGGEESHSLTINEIPAHTHQIKGSENAANEVSPQNNVWANQTNLYSTGSPGNFMNSGAITTAGESLPHNNLQPFLALHFCIAVTGIYPSRN